MKDLKHIKRFNEATENLNISDVISSNSDYTLIKRGTNLPDDFVKDGVLNRKKYIIEHGFSEKNKWYDEFSSPVTAEIIGAIVIGSDSYNDFRYRIRDENDPEWDLTKTTIGKIMNSGIF
jgi:hypothetical protein